MLIVLEVFGSLAGLPSKGFLPDALGVPLFLKL
jgi:hypothetical protein